MFPNLVCHLEPRNLPEPLLGTLTWNLGTCRNLYLEPLLGTSEPARTWRDDCPRVPQGLVWLGPQSFQLLGKNSEKRTQPIRLQGHTSQKLRSTAAPSSRSCRWPSWSSCVPGGISALPRGGFSSAASGWFLNTPRVFFRAAKWLHENKESAQKEKTL